MSGYIVVPPSQPEQQPQQASNDGSGLAMIVIAVLFGAIGVVGGYHAGMTRNDIALSKLRDQAAAAADQYAACKAWVETQNTRVESFYREYTGGAPSQ